MDLPIRRPARRRRLAVVAAALLAVVVLGACQPPPGPTAEWYGYVSLSKHHTYSYPGYSVRYDVDLVARAPDRVSLAGVLGAYQVVWTYAAPPQPACYLAEERWSAPTVNESAVIEVDYSTTGLPAVISVDADPFPYQVTRRYAGTNPYGGSCQPTTTEQWEFDLFQSTGEFRDTAATTTRTVAGLAAGTATGSGNLADRVAWDWSLARIPLTTEGRNYDLGDDDQLVLLRPDETVSVNSRLPYFTEIAGQPLVCDYSFVKRVSQVCSLYKAFLRADWAGNKFMLQYAARSQKCGLYVIDGAPWRPPKLRPATDGSGTNIAAVGPGQRQVVKTATGTITVTC